MDLLENIQVLRAELATRSAAPGPPGQIPFNHIFDSLEVAIALLDSSYNYIYVNNIYKSLTGRPANSLIGKNHFTLFPAREYEELFQQVLQTGSPINRTGGPGELPLVVQSANIWCDWSLTLIQTPGGIDRLLLLTLTDVTGRMDAVRVLETDRHRYLAATEEAGIGIWDWDLGSGKFDCSPECYRIFGYEFGDIDPTVENFLPSVLPTDLASVKSAAKRTMEGSPLDMKYHIIRQDGEVRQVHAEATLISNAQGDPTRIIGTVRDITEQGAREDRWRKFEAILDTSPDMVALVDRNYIFETVNDTYCKVTGLARDQIIGHTITEVWGADNFTEFMRAKIDACLEGQVLDFQQWLTIDGRRRFMDAVYRPFYADNKTVSHVIVMGRDITDAKEAMIALEASEKKLAGILDLAMEGIVSMDADQTITLFNRGAESIFGYRASEVLGQKINLLIPGRFHASHAEHVGNFQKSRDKAKWMSEPRQVYGKRKSGEEFPIEASISKLEIDGGQVYTVVLRDITQRLLAAEALAVSEQQLRSFQENVKEGIFRTTVDGRWMYANPALIDILGYDSQEELLAQEVVQSYINPDERQAWLGQFGPQEYIKDHEMQLKRKDGTLIWVRENAHSVLDENGTVVRYEGTLTDITPSKQAEEQLAIERERLATTLRSIEEAVIATDIAGRIIVVNLAAERLLKLGRDAIINQPLGDILKLQSSSSGRPFIIPIDSLLAGDQKAMPPRRLQLAGEGGELIPVVVRISHLEDSDGHVNGLVAVIQDMTEKELLEADLLRAQKLESLGVLAGGLAHDFNNFLMSIMLNISTAGLFARENPKVLELLAAAEESIKRAKGITQQLMAFTRGSMPMRADMRIGPLIKEAVKFCLRGTPFQATFKISAKLRPASVDPGQINQVINNLVINAIQAMPDGGKITVSAANRSVTAKHPVGQLPEGPYLEIAVQDTGVGIPPEHRQRIFDPYYTTREEGTGLGLFSVFNIIDKHGGWINVDSKPGEGTLFKFYLPATDEAAVDSTEDSGEIINGSGRILIMDDDELVRKSLVRLLSTIGYEVSAARNGEEAMELFRASVEAKQEWEALILDLTVPGGMGGEETILAIRELDADVPAIAISGYTNSLTMLEPATAHFQDRLAKPFTLAELSQALGRVLRKRPGPDS